MLTVNYENILKSIESNTYDLNSIKVKCLFLKYKYNILLIT